MKRRKPTQPGCATTAHVANAADPAGPILEIPDPTCNNTTKEGVTCGECWTCRRKAEGPLYYLNGAPPKGKR